MTTTRRTIVCSGRVTCNHVVHISSLCARICTNYIIFYAIKNVCSVYMNYLVPVCLVLVCIALLVGGMSVQVTLLIAAVGVVAHLIIQPSKHTGAKSKSARRKRINMRREVFGGMPPPDNEPVLADESVSDDEPVPTEHYDNLLYDTPLETYPPEPIRPEDPLVMIERTRREKRIREYNPHDIELIKEEPDNHRFLGWDDDDDDDKNIPVFTPEAATIELQDDTLGLPDDYQNNNNDKKTIPNNSSKSKYRGTTERVELEWYMIYDLMRCSKYIGYYLNHHVFWNIICTEYVKHSNYVKLHDTYIVYPYQFDKMMVEYYDMIAKQYKNDDVEALSKNTDKYTLITRLMTCRSLVFNDTEDQHITINSVTTNCVTTNAEGVALNDNWQLHYRDPEIREKYSDDEEERLKCISGEYRINEQHKTHWSAGVVKGLVSNQIRRHSAYIELDFKTNCKYVGGDRVHKYAHRTL